MSSTPITLPRHLVNSLLHAAQATPQSVICGLIGAIGGVPTRIYPVANAAPPPAQGWQLDAEQTRDVREQMDRQGEAVFAVYSSHPHALAKRVDTDDIPSDLHGALYLNISLNIAGVLELRAFCRQGGGEYHELALLLAEED